MASRQSTRFATGDSGQKLTKICGAVRRRWIYVGRVSGRDVTVEDVREHLMDLKDLEGFGDIVVTKLRTRGNNSAFSVGLPNEELYGRVFNEGYWSKGIALREFDLRRTFFQQRQQQDQMSTQQNRQTQLTNK